MLNLKNNNKIISSFDKNIFDFKKYFLLLLGQFTTDLEFLHLFLPNKYLNSPIVTPNNDQDLAIYEMLYSIDIGYTSKDDTRGDFLALYDNFVNFIALNIFRKNLVFQSKPTLRISLPNNMAVGGWHRDRDYNHPDEEINIWLPITSAINTNTIHIESFYDKADYLPMNLSYGEFLLFDSALMHGNVINTENKTRISFDFRVIEEDIFKENNKASLDQKKKFEIGHYYKKTNLIF